MMRGGDALAAFLSVVGLAFGGLTGSIRAPHRNRQSQENGGFLGCGYSNREVQRHQRGHSRTRIAKADLTMICDLAA